MTSTPDRAFTEFVNARYRAMVRRAYLLTGDADSAADLVQAALVRLYPRWKRLRNQQAAEPYVNRSVVNLYIDSRRRAIRSHGVDEPLDLDAVDPSHLHDKDPTVASDDRLAIEQGLRALSPQQRAAIILRYWDEQSFPEIARELNCSESTAKTHVRRAIANLRQLGITTDS